MAVTQPAGSLFMIAEAITAPRCWIDSAWQDHPLSSPNLALRDDCVLHPKDTNKEANTLM